MFLKYLCLLAEKMLNIKKDGIFFGSQVRESFKRKRDGASQLEASSAQIYDRFSTTASSRFPAGRNRSRMNALKTNKNSFYFSGYTETFIALMFEQFIMLI